MVGHYDVLFSDTFSNSYQSQSRSVYNIICCLVYTARVTGAHTEPPHALACNLLQQWFARIWFADFVECNDLASNMNVPIVLVVCRFLLSVVFVDLFGEIWSMVRNCCYRCRVATALIPPPPPLLQVYYTGRQHFIQHAFRLLAFLWQSACCSCLE